MLDRPLIDAFQSLQKDNATLKATVARLEKVLEAFTQRMLTMELTQALQESEPSFVSVAALQASVSVPK